MADTETPENDAGEKKKKGLPPAALPALALVLGMGGGGFLGAAVVAPKLTHGIGTGAVSAAELSVDQAKAGKKAAHDDEESAEDEDGHTDGEESEEGEEGGDDAKKKEGGDHAAAAPSVYTVADMVLNPAGSGGSRFVMLSVAMEVKDSVASEQLRTRDAEIRDAIGALVGSKTVEQLADVAAREPLKAEIMTTVARITKKKKAVKRVSFPQFVIQ